LGFLANFIQTEADAGDPGFAKLASWNMLARTRERAALLRDQDSPKTLPLGTGNTPL